MMMKPRVIRLWAPAIVLAGIAIVASPDQLKAQAASKAPQASQSTTQSLLEKAQGLEARGRLDLAVQVWQQILLSEPRNTEALGNLARASRLEGDTKLATSYLERLRAINPNDPNIARVESTEPSQNQKAKLQQAAKLSDAGKYAEAMTIYRQVFGTHPPPGDSAVAYYETESATGSGRPAAIEGLRALVEKYPSDPRYQISLGRVLTYDPATREEGRKYLVKFPKDAKASQGVRQSLLWDAANPEVAPQIRAYLAVHQDPQLAAVFQAAQPPAKTASVTPSSAQAVPPDVAPASRSSAATAAAPTATSPSAAKPSAAIAEQKPTSTPSAPPSGAPLAKQSLASVPPPASTPTEKASATSTPWPGDGATTRVRGAAAEVAAYQALNANRIQDAETRFKAILAGDASNPKALAGMGYVRMQQGNFLGAISFLEQAKRGDPEDKGVVSALDTSRFWFIMGEGQTALNSNDLTTAEKRYRSAMELRPTNVEALLGLGQTLLKAQQPAPATPLFERAAASQPALAEAWRGLFMAQFQGGNPTLALNTVSRIPAAQLAQLMNDPLFLQPLASAYAAVGRSEEARATLESALKQSFPAAPPGLKADIQSQLAVMFATSNHLDQAASIYKQLTVDDPQSAAAWQGLIRSQHALQHDQEAMQTFESMPPAVQTAAMRDPNFEMTIASIEQSQKKLDAAQELLQKAITEQASAGGKPSPAVQMQLAGLYVDRGAPQLAYPIYEQVVHDNPDRADAWAGLLSTLHVTGHDKEAVAQLKLVPAGVRPQLEANPSYLQTMAAVYGALGRSREATQFLGRVEQDYAAHRALVPASLEIQNAWLLYNGMDDAGLYRQLMSLGARADLSDEQRRTVQTIWTNWAARRANQAAAVGNQRRALAILNAAARSFPDNPAAIKSLASAYANAGEPHQAVLIYKAQNMSKASVPDYVAAVGAALADGDIKEAEIWTRYALAEYPNDAQIFILAARFEQARGDTAKAIKYYNASLKAMPPAPPVSKLAAELGLSAPSSPGSLPSAEKPQALSALLAPENLETSPQGSGSEPYPPGRSGQAPLPPYDGSSQLVPPYMTTPGAAAEPTQAAAASGPGRAEVQSTVQSAASTALNQPGTSPQQSASASPSTASQEAYRPYVAYVAPPPPAPQNSAAVAVQLGGGNTPRPTPPPTDVTDVLPTARYSQSARANRAAASHDEVAAARAARIRRLQEDSARTGQSHPPSEDTITATPENAEYTGGQSGPQVAQPTTQPAKQIGRVPDTGAQQYPQPSTPPKPSPQTTITRTRPRAQPQDTTASAATPTPAAQPPAVSAPPPAAVTTAPQVQPAPQGPLPVPPAYPLAPPPTDAELRARNVPPLGGFFESQAPMPMTQRQQAESELASLEGSYSGWLGATGVARYRSGTAGLDRLYDFESPAEASAVISRRVRATIVAQPVFLNSGVLNSTGFSSNHVPYLGTLPGSTATAPAQQFSNGIGGELQLTSKNIGVAVGYTPYQFLVQNVTARLRVSFLDNHVSLYGTREAVKDTQLSYAGLHDPGKSNAFTNGPIWGGVVATTGGARLDFRGGNTDLYVAGDAGTLTGQHVVDNVRYGGTVGANFQVGNWHNVGSLAIGGALAGMHYDHNEAGLTYGQGGYFSPDYYLLASVPVSFAGQYKKNFHYAFSSSLGVRTFEEAQALFYPLDPTLQATFVPPAGSTCTATQTPSYACGQYPLTDTTAFSYLVNSQVSYRFADHWYGGGFVSANNTNNYNNVVAGFFFRYVFRAQHSLEGYPAGMFRFDGLRPLQIP